MIRSRDLRPVAVLAALAVVAVSLFTIAVATPDRVSAQGVYDGPITDATGPAFFGPAPNPNSYCDNAAYFPPLNGNVANIGSIDPGYTDTVTEEGIDLTYELTGEGVAGAIYPGFFPGGDQPKGVEMQQGDTATVTLSQPLFYSQWIFTDVDRVSEGFDVVPQWSAGQIGEAVAYGGDPNFTFAGSSATLVDFDDTDAAAQPSEALAGRVQVDFIGAVDGITMARTPGSSGQSGFAAGGGCEAVGSAKALVSGPTWNGTAFEAVYEIRVRNNLPTTAVIQQVAAGADFVSGPLEGIPLDNISIDDTLTTTGFTAVNVTVSNPTGGLALNPGYDGVAVTELAAVGATVAPSTEELIRIEAEYIPDLSSPEFNACTSTYEIGNQATLSAEAAGVVVTDLTDDGIDSIPGADNGDGTLNDITVVGFPCVAALEIVKTVVPGPAGVCPTDFAGGTPGDGVALPVDIGDTVTYCITVLNSGPGLASGVDVTDPQAPAGFWTVTDIPGDGEVSVSYDLPVSLAGPAALNTATATGTGPDGVALGPVADTALIDPPVAAPALEIVKTVVPGPGGICPVDFAGGTPGDGTALVTNIGDTVTYCITVLNSGNTDLTNVVIDDPQGPFNLVVGALAVGAEATGTFDVAVVDATPAQNTATATGDSPDGPLAPVTDTALIEPPVSAPALSIVKTVVAGPGGTCPADFAGGTPGDGTALPTAFGDTVTYCITVLNSGNVDLDDVVVADAQAPAGFNGAVGALAVGAEANLSYDLAVDDTTPAVNTATADGTFNGVGVPQASDTALIAPPVPAPSLDVVKTVLAGPGAACPAFAAGVAGLGTALPVAVGDTVTYCVTVINSGNVDLATVTITDPQAPAGFGAIGALAVGAEATDSYDVTIEFDTPVVNTAEAVGADEDGNQTPVVDDPAQITPPATNPSLDIVKTVLLGPGAVCPNFAGGIDGIGPALPVDVGQTVTYCISIINDGDVDLVNVTVTDAQAPAGFGNPGALPVGAEVTASYDVVITATTPTTNTASVSGEDPNGAPVGPVSDPALIDPEIPVPSIDIVKTVLAGPGATCPAFGAGAPGLGAALPVDFGDTVTYCVSVLNTGNVDLTDVTLSDPQAPAGWGVIGLLAEGAEATDSYDVVIDPATPATNTATVNANDPLGEPLAPVEDPAQIAPPAPVPALEIVKTVLVGPAATCPAFDAGVAGLGAALPVDAGDTVTYCISVRNVGNVPVTDVAVTDAQAPAGFGTPPFTLQPGEETALFFDLVVDETTPIVNTASVTGNGPGGALPPVDDPAQIDPTFPAPSIDIVKTVLAGPGATCPAFGAGAPGLGAALPVDFGDTVTYCVSVLNTGNVDLTDVTLSDPQAPAGWGVIGLLAEGAEATDSYDVVIDPATPATNTATVNANDPLGEPLAPVEDPAQIAPPAPAPALDVVKTVVAGPAGTCPATFADGVAGLGAALPVNFGDTVTYCITVINSGNVIASNVAVTDAQAPAGFGNVGTLAPGAESSLSYDITVDPTTSATNIASVTGSGPDGAAIPPAEDPAQIAPPVPDASLAVIKTVLQGPGATCPAFADGTLGLGQALSVEIGSTVTFCVAVRNPGNLPVDDVLLTDAQAPAGWGVIGTLTPGAEATDSYDVVIAADTPTTNTVTASGVGPDGQPVPEPSDPALIAPIPQNPSFDVVKTALPGPAAACPSFADGVTGTGPAVPAALGDVITFCISVLNTGDVDLTNVVVSDPQAPAGFWTIGDLAAGVELTNSYDITVGLNTPAVNTATLTGDGPDGPLAPEADPAVLDPEIPAPAFDVIKTVVPGPAGVCPAYDDAVDGVGPALPASLGATVTYCVSVANLGNVALTNVVVSDPQAPAGFWTVGNLAIGADATNSYDITVGLDTPSTNTATVTGDGPNGPLPPTSDPAAIAPESPNPAFDVVKTVVGGPNGICPSFADGVAGIGAALPAGLGETVTYCVAVINSGNVDLTNVAVNDPQAPAGFWIVGDLPVGTEASNSYDIVVALGTPATNTATVTGDGPGGPLPPTSDPAAIAPEQGAPAFEVIKTVVPGPGGACPTHANGVSGVGAALDAPLGSTVTYCVSVANTGNVALTNVAVSDPQAPAGFWTIGDLAIGAELQNSYDVVIGLNTPANNTATLTGDGPDGPLDPTSDPAIISPEIPAPAYGVVKSVVLGPDGSCPSFADGDAGLGSPLDASLGQTVTYCVAVANLGNVALTNVAVSDPQAPAGFWTIGDLAVGAEVSNSYDVVVGLDTPATNTATVTGDGPDGPLPPTSDPAAITPEQPGPNLEVVKTAVLGPNGDCPSFADGETGVGTVLDVGLGQSVTYCVSVANTGNVDLTDVGVTDPQAPAGFWTIGDLAVGAELTNSYDIVVGLDTPANNTATATGNGPDGPLPPVSDPAVISPELGAPAYGIVKTVVTGPAGACPSYANGESGLGTALDAPLGSTVTYCVAVANLGNVPLINVVVSDPQAPAGFWTIGDLAVGAELSNSYDIVVTTDTPATNTATVSGDGPNGPLPEVADAAAIRPEQANPTFDIVKTVVPGPNGTCPAFVDGTQGIGTPLIAMEGDIVTYCVTVINTGNVGLTNVEIDDNQAPDDFGQIAALAIGQQVTEAYDVPVLSDTVPMNVAFGSALSVTGDPVPEVSDPAMIAPVLSAPAYDIVKTVVIGPDGDCPTAFADGTQDAGDPVRVGNGDVVTYCVNVINLGNVDLFEVMVTDPQAPIGFWTIGTLPVGEEAANSYDVAVVSTTVPMNTATLNAQDGSGNPLTPVSDVAVLDRASPSYEIIKTVVTGPSGACPAFADAVRGLGAPLEVELYGTATYCVIVRNTGDVELTNVTVTDSQAPDGFWNQSTLAVAGEVSVSYDIVVTPDTPVANTAVLNAEGPDGPLASVEDSAIIDPPFPAPDYDVVKTVVAGPDGDCPSFADGVAGPGSAVSILRNATATFCVSVVNIGNVPLVNVTVSDPQAPAGFWTIGDLAVGAEVTNSYDIVVTHETPEENVATLNAETPDGVQLPPEQDTSVIVPPPPPEADLTVDKTGSVELATAGGTATYTVVVENLGPDAAPGATFTDTLPSGVELSAVPVVDGWSCELDGNELTCDKAEDFAVNEPQTFTYDVTVVTTATNATLTNTVVVTSDLPDADPTNNEDETTVRTPPPDRPVIKEPETFGPPATAMRPPIRTPLAVTGTNSSDLVMVGLAMLLLGWGVVVVSRKRLFEE